WRSTLPPVSTLHERVGCEGAAGAELFLLSQPAPRRRADPREPTLVSTRASAPLSAGASDAGRRVAMGARLSAPSLGAGASGSARPASASHRVPPIQRRDARGVIRTEWTRRCRRPSLRTLRAPW